MGNIETIEARRQAIVKEIFAIRSMCKGTINEQYLEVTRPGRKKAVRLGPYYVLSRYEGKRTVSRRLRAGEELEQARRDVAEHKRFVALCREFEDLTEKLGQMEREGKALGVEKKRRSWQSSKMKR